MRRSTPRVLASALVVCFVPTQAGAVGGGGPWTVVPMKGQTQFVFASSCAPEAYPDMVAHINMMQQRQFGNGTDVFLGPETYTQQQYQYMAQLGWQIVAWHNTAFPGIFAPNNPPMNATQKSILSITDKPGAPTPVHFGEWDYTFHHLLGQPNNGYGSSPPTTKQQAYNALKAYYTERNNTYEGRLYSVNGHSNYEPYAAEWGTQGIGMELGENIRFTQSKIAMARGASRQYSIPWSAQFSAWFAGCLTTTGPLTGGQWTARGADAGHSQSLFERTWKHVWFAGAGMVTPEGGGFYLYEEGGAAPYTMTSLGVKANNFYKLTLSHDRGVPYTPLAIVLDRYAGYNGYDDRPWGIINKTSGDQQLHDLFQQQLFPGSAGPIDYETPYLVSTPYGEMSDVLLSTAQSGTLANYPEILLAGDISFDSGFVNQLKGALQSGSRLLLKQEHVNAMGVANFSQLQSAGSVEVLAAWTNPATGRPAAISNARLAQINNEHVPIAVSGSAIQYQVNRNSSGWVIELINDNGITKQPWLPAVIDNNQTAYVTLQSRLPGTGYYAIDWESGVATALTGSPSSNLAITPGTVRYFQIAQNQWKASGSGDWSAAANWLVEPPNGIGTGANFLGAITSPATITLNGSKTVGQIAFDNPHRYTIVAGGASVLTLHGSGSANVALSSGDHSILAPLSLLSSTTITGTGALTTGHITNSANLSALTTLTAADISGPGSVSVADNTVLTARSIQQSGLSISPGAVVTSMSDGGTNRLQSLTIAGGGRLDLTNNDLIIDYAVSSPLAAVRQLLAAGYNAGNWNGAGLTSSAAATAATPATALGYGEAAALGLASFSGQSVDATCVLVKYTYAGDANLDGQVDITDLGQLATAWQSAAPWTGGDFSYNNVVDITDLGILATNWQAGVDSPLAPSSLERTLAGLGLPAVRVPEPSTGMLCGAIGLLLLGRIRKSR